MDLFEGYINSLNFELPDKDAEVIDNILARYLVAKYPDGFELDWQKRDLCVFLYKKSKRIAKQVLNDKEFLPYLKALFEGVEKASPTTQTACLASFILGYTLRAIQPDKRKRGKQPPK